MLTIFLITCQCSSDQSVAKKLDWKFVLQFMRSYLCTGNLDWWEEVEDGPVLKLILHTSVLYNCEQERLLEEKVVVELLQDAISTFQKQPWMKRVKVTDCLWSAIKKLHFAPFFCPGTSDKFRENLDKSWDDLYEGMCEQSIGTFSHLRVLCKVKHAVLTNRDAIREAVNPYLCYKPRQKRQYDIVSMMAVLNQAACWDSDENDIKTAVVEEGDVVYFTGWSLLCCISKFIDS